MDSKQALKTMCALAQGKIRVKLDEKGQPQCHSKDWVDCIVAVTLDAAFVAGFVVGVLAAVSLWILIN